MLRSSLAWKLSIWFLLLSLLPIGVIVLFVRQDVSEELTNLAKEDTRSRASLLASNISSSIDDRQVQRLITDATNESQTAFLVKEDGAYVAHGEASRVGGLMPDDFSTEVVRQVLNRTNGVLVEDDTGRLVGFSSVPAAFTKAVLAVDESVVSAPMLRIERSALIQLVVSLLVIDVAIGVAIWIVFRPIQTLTRAAKEVGAGNLDVRIDPADMEGELEVLTNAFNEMTKRIRGAHEELEQRVADRTAELSESEERLRTVVAGAPILLFAVDRHQVMTFAEGQGIEAFGIKGSEVEGLTLDHLATRLPQVVDDVRRALTGEAFTATVQFEGTTWEMVYSPHVGDNDEVAGVIGVCTDITERKQAEQTMRELAVVEERNRMAREIHDTLAQGFTGIVLQLEAAEQASEGSPAEVPNHLSRAKNLARESLQEARRSVWDLLPRALEERSIQVALHQLVDRWTADGPENASFSISGEKREVSSDIQVTLLRVCQESLTNIRRHARATNVQVDLAFYPECTSLGVQDDGKGFNFEKVRAKGRQSGFGLSREVAPEI